MLMAMFSNLKYLAVECTSGGDFLGMPTWYKYICGKDLGTPEAFIGALPLILLAVVEILLRIAGIAAIAYVVFGSIKYVVSQGEPDKTSEAKGTIINALVGLIIAALAIAMVTFVGNRIGA